MGPANLCQYRGRNPPATAVPTSTPFASTRLGGFLLQNRRWVVLSMLLALHAGLIASPGGNLQRTWLLVHFGLFLMWQPFVEAEQELGRFAVALLKVDKCT